METKLEICRFDSKDIITTSSYCKTHGTAGSSLEYYQGAFYTQLRKTPPNPFILDPNFKTYDINNQEVSGPEDEKWYHCDENGNLYECGDESHHQIAPGV